jgi:hypothetical protein
MTVLGPLGFTAPWLLLGLVALPVLWFILRAVPPAPVRRRFPGVALLLGLADEEVQAERTPWWLMLLRILAVAAAILGFAGPVLNPQPEVQIRGDGGADYDAIGRIIYACQRAGIAKVGFITEPPVRGG